MAERTKDVPTAPNAVNPTLLTNYDNSRETGSVNATQTRLDPYYVQSKAMYESLVKNPFDMVMVELGIIGDPVYLAMGGVSNFDSPSSNGIIAENGSVNQNYGIPYIKINFRNPTDIGTSGFLEFNSGRIEFSGIYMVKKVISKFSNGVFTQRMTLGRMSQSPNKVSEGSLIDSGKSTNSLDIPLTKEQIEATMNTDLAKSIARGLNESTVQLQAEVNALTKALEKKLGDSTGP